MAKSTFLIELEHLLNRESMENGSNTPDFILATYLLGCLEVFEVAISQREAWYERSPDAAPPLSAGGLDKEVVRPS